MDALSVSLTAGLKQSDRTVRERAARAPLGKVHNRLLTISADMWVGMKSIRSSS